MGMKKRQITNTPARLRWILTYITAALLFAACATPCHSNNGARVERILDDRDARWEIMADKMSYSLDDTLYIAEGNVTITRSGQVLSAERAMYNNNTGIVQVFGNVRLEANGDLFSGETGIFDLKSHYGQITRGSLFLRENNVHIQGTSMVRTGPNTYVVRGCRVTTCNGDIPDWSITGSEVKVTLEGYGQVRNAAFRIRNFPVFYIPYAIFPVKTKRQTGLLLPRLGYSDLNGYDIELPFFWAISEQIDATLYKRYLSKRGFMQGLEFRSLTKEVSKGVFIFDILSDKIATKDLSEREQVDISPFSRTNQTRYWFRSSADQKLPGGMEARLDTDLVSDQDYLREFRGSLYGFQARPELEETSGRPVDDIYSSLRRSALRMSRDGESYSLQALASYYENPMNPPNDNTPQPILGLNFTGLSRRVPGLPLFAGVDAEYDYVWREEGQKGHRASISPAATYPLRLGRYAEVRQSLALFLGTQWLDESYEGIDRLTSRAYESKTTLSTIMEKAFDFRYGDVRKLNHKITPSLTYTYRGYNEGDKESPWFEPIDEVGGINKITFSLENLLNAKKKNDKGAVSYAQWASFTLIQSYDVNEARRDDEPLRPKRPFDPLTGVLSLKPFRYLDFQAITLWDHYENHVSYADLSLDLKLRRSGGRTDILEIDYLYQNESSKSLNCNSGRLDEIRGAFQYQNESGKSLNCNLYLNLDYGFSVGSSLRKDFDSSDDLETTYWLDYASQCWGVRLIVEDLDDSKRFMLVFRIPSLGELKSL